MRKFTRVLHLAVCLVSLVYLYWFNQHPSVTLMLCLLCLQLFGIQLTLRHLKEIERDTRHTPQAS